MEMFKSRSYVFEQDTPTLLSTLHTLLHVRVVGMSHMQGSGNFPLMSLAPPVTVVNGEAFTTVCT